MAVQPVLATFLVVPVAEDASGKMIGKGLIALLFLLLSATGIKAHGMRLLIIACAGLAGMYMIHLLAQDYNKYQALNRPGRSIRVSRSVADNFTNDAFFDAPVTPSLSEEIEKAEDRYRGNELLSLDKILRFDPLGCARRYVCTLAAKSTKKLTQTEKNIIQMLRNLTKRNKPDSGQSAFRHALDLGRRKRDSQACAEEYPKCFLSISQMLKLVGFL